MDKKTIILIAVVSILILAAVGSLVFVLMNKNSEGSLPGPKVSENGEIIYEQVPLEEAEKQVNKDFPDTLTGTLEFGANDKATLKTSTKTYTFTPDQPKGIYESFGVEEGDRVTVKCKILDNNTIQLFSMDVAK
jgi:hypothetical protein